MMTHFSVTGESRDCHRKKVLVAGLGNELLMDDGVGVHSIRELRNSGRGGALLVEVGTAVLDALHLFEEADEVIVIDAMQAGNAPGTVYSFSISDIKETQVQTSLHQLSLVEALRFLPDESLPKITILGVEPKDIDYGLDLSAEVQRALPCVVEEVHRTLEQWEKETLPVG